MSTRNHLVSRFAILLTLFCFISSAYADKSELRGTLFSKADNLLKESKAAQAELLSPKNYAEAVSLYKKAEGRLKKGHSIEKIRKDLDKSINYLEAALETTRLAEVTFVKVMQARNDATASLASKFAQDDWNKAESQFGSATRVLEGGNVKKARKYASNAETSYRDAELAAIKVNYLSETRKLIASAKKAKVYKLAPKTLARAESLLTQAEEGLSSDRYDTDKPRLLAKQAKYEAKHAIYVANIVSSLRNKSLTAEDFILQSEKPVVKIASALDLVVEFDEGLEQPTQQIRQQISNLREESLELAERQNQVLNLETEIKGLEQKLGGQSERLAKQEKHRQRLKQVESLFTPQEAIVLSQRGNILIRAIGLNFSSGSAQIESQYFSLLKKVQQVLSQYPDASIVIEGHTDAFGSDATNLELSERRADAVRGYILANMPGLSRRINATGYGESRPRNSRRAD